MKRLLLGLLVPMIALAHEGEAVEEHSAFAVASDRAGEWIVAHGALVFGLVFVALVVAVILWLRRTSSARNQ